MSNEEVIEKICHNIQLMTLPVYWKYDINKGKKTYIALYTVKTNEDEVGISIEKQIFLETDLIIKCKLYNKYFDIQDLCTNSKIMSVDDVISILNVLNTKKVCEGGSLVKEFDGITIDCAEKVIQDRWRHKKCEYLIDMSSVKRKCIFYAKLRIAFRMKKLGLSDGKCARLTLSPSKKKQLDQFRNKKHNIQKQVLREKHRVLVLQNQLNEVKEKLNKLPDTMVEDIIIKNKFNDS